MPDDTTPTLTDHLVATLLSIHDGARYEGTHAETLLRLRGLIDDDGPTERGTEMAESIRAEALQQWEADRVTPEVAGLLAAVTEALTVPHPVRAEDAARADRLMATRAAHVRGVLATTEVGASVEGVAAAVRHAATDYPATYPTVRQGDDQ